MNIADDISGVARIMAAAGYPKSAILARSRDMLQEARETARLDRELAYCDLRRAKGRKRHAPDPMLDLAYRRKLAIRYRADPRAQQYYGELRQRIVSPVVTLP